MIWEGVVHISITDSRRSHDASGGGWAKYCILFYLRVFLSPAGCSPLLISASCARIVCCNASIPFRLWSVLSRFSATPWHHSFMWSNCRCILPSPLSILSSIRLNFLSNLSSSPSNRVANRGTSSRMSCTSSSSRNTGDSCVAGTITSGCLSGYRSLTSNEVSGNVVSGMIEMPDIIVSSGGDGSIDTPVSCPCQQTILGRLIMYGCVKRSTHIPLDCDAPVPRFLLVWWSLLYRCLLFAVGYGGSVPVSL